MLCQWGGGHQGGSHPGLAQKPRCLEPKGPSVAVNSLKHVNKQRRPCTKQQLRPGPLPLDSHFITCSCGRWGSLPTTASEPRCLPLQCSLQCQSCPTPLLAQAGVTRPLKLRLFSVAPVKSTFLLPIGGGGVVAGLLPASLRLFLGPN